MFDKYVLVDKIVVPELDLIRWGKALENGFRVALDEFDGITVSTVFLGLDHSYRDSDIPILFETMVFFDSGGYESQYMERCSTYDEALAQHKRVVEMYKKESTKE